MDYIAANNYEHLGQLAARLVAREILLKPNLVLGLPTGSTPVSMYNYLVRFYQEGLISFKEVKTFNLDEYIGLARHHPQSYFHFMHKHLWSLVDLLPDNCEIPNGLANDILAECKRYDKKLEEAEGIDLQILGIGLNGHIGFNEPSHDLKIRTHVVHLTPETINANARFFQSTEQVPKKAVTMGIGSIMQAKKILLLVSGEAKKNILYKTLSGPVSTEVPASILQLHSNLTVISDIK